MVPFQLTFALAACLLAGSVAPAMAQTVIMAPGSTAPSEEDPYLFHVYGTRPGEPVTMRSGAGTAFRAIATLADGEPVQKLSCREDRNGYWCRVASTGRPRISGWVIGRALHEDSVSHRTAPSTDDYVADGMAQGVYDATGPIRCQADNSQPMDDCQYGIVRNGPQANLDVTLPDGSRRSIDYRAGRFSNRGGERLRSHKQGGDAVITLDDGVTLFVPDDVVMGQ
ncbi:MAG: hypothetical protein ACOH2J_05275 [Allorhizobium sp.]